MSSIEVRDLDLTLGTTHVLRSLSLSVPEGAVTAVLGQSGCGKTSLLRALAGLVRPQSGTIRIGEGEVFGPGTWLRPEQRNVGIVPQEGALFPHLTVAGNVAFGLKGAGKRKQQRTDELLVLVGMAGTAALRPDQLSGGMQQRVAVARALARRPGLVLLDEPFSALDAGLREEVRRDVLAAVRADGSTALLVTHDQDEALSTANRVAIMRNGQIVQEASPSEIYEWPVDLDTARFVGEALEFPATVVGTHGDFLTVDGPGGRIRARVGPGTPAMVGGVGTVIIRPEDLILSDTDGEAGNDLGIALVTSVSYHGHGCLVSATLASGSPLTIRSLGAPRVRPGDTGRVTLTKAPLFLASHRR